MELVLDYMERVDMHVKGHGRGHARSRNLKAIVKLHMVSVDMNTRIK